MNNTALKALLFLCLMYAIRLNAQTPQWTFVGGTTTPNASPVYGSPGIPDPGARYNHSGWKDGAGNFWIFGGTDAGGNIYNDLWEFTTSGHWIFISGDQIPGAHGVYSSSAGTPHPGARMGQAGWSDAQGNFWIFGGQGYDGNSGNGIGFLNDLWEFTPGLGWTWVSGSSTYNRKGTMTTWPSSRYGCSGWSDPAGNVYIFGGNGYGVLDISLTMPLNDVWKYDPNTNIWTNVMAETVSSTGTTPSNKGTPGGQPGTRYSQSGSADALGNFWMFGGIYTNTFYPTPQGPGFSYYNDLWEYSPATNSWTWWSGDLTANNHGVYGPVGSVNATNKPGARYQSLLLTDITGNVWLYGGYGLDRTDRGFSVLNDFWVFNKAIANGEWGFVSGSDLGGQPPVYGNQGKPAAANTPGSRQGMVGALDANNKLWLHGGQTNFDSVFADVWTTPAPPAFLILPLKEVLLQGSPQGTTNLLTWQTLGELNTKEFQVQRGTDGYKFDSIGTITADGNGDHSYSFTDAGLASNGNAYYYRLKMIDNDRTSAYSQTIVIHHTDATSNVQIYPNPARNATTLQITGNSNLLNTQARLHDANGRLIREYLITGLQQTIDLTHVPQGIYLLQLANGTTIRIAKE